MTEQDEVVTPRERLLRAEVERLRLDLIEAQRGRAHLRELVGRPYIGVWSDEVIAEAAHQRERFGAGGDAGKAPADWFWLLGFLAGKALAAHQADDLEKARHHTVSSGAVLAHWAAAIGGEESVFRPGLGAEGLARIGQQQEGASHGDD